MKKFILIFLIIGLGISCSSIQTKQKEFICNQLINIDSFENCNYYYYSDYILAPDSSIRCIRVQYIEDKEIKIIDYDYASLLLYSKNKNSKISKFFKKLLNQFELFKEIEEKIK